MSGRGRGRGRRVAAQTLSGAAAVTAAGGAGPSPSPAPERSAASSRASSTAESTPAPPPGATDDAPNDAASRGSGDKPARAAAGVRRVPSVGVGSTRAPSVGLLARTPSIGPPGVGTMRERPVGGLLGSTSEFRPSANAGTSSGKAKFKPNMKRRDKALEVSDDECVLCLFSSLAEPACLESSCETAC